VGIEAFGNRKRDRRRAELAQLLRAEAQDRGALDEIAGPSSRSCCGPRRRIEVRLTKSRTERPEEKRAERAVGRTWFEPPT